ncbi:MAG TPA: hypothetical protein VGK48_20465 [Terriglobia bacterium]|jgi:hypothetical protein
MSKESHIPAADLILAADGEVSLLRRYRIHRHLVRCGTCRSRMKEIEDTTAGFMHAYRDEIDAQLPSVSAPRALLRARLSQLASEHGDTVWQRIFPSMSFRRAAYLAVIFILAAANLVLWQSSRTTLASTPNPSLTPGVALPLTEGAICSTVLVKRSHAELAVIGKEIFEKYGIRNPGSGHYELDYLIDPELGGADDARNLWPQPYSVSWNAHVKDALESHLRELVCTGQLSLAEAQHDIASDWIAAYKKYFHTDHPLPAHLAFEKDEPWID